MADEYGEPQTQDVTDVIGALGKDVLRAWDQVDSNCAAFPAIAAEALAGHRLHETLTYEALLTHVIVGGGLPFQQYFAHPFGQPPVTLFWTSRFHVQALFWATATTAIHNHTFCGAFTVLHGSSLQTTYSFDTQDEPQNQIRLGVLIPRRAEILRRGAIQQILPDDLFIHSAFHLDNPSVTIVVRTHTGERPQPSSEFFPPFVAINEAIEDQYQTRRIQSLGLLANIGSGSYAPLARALMSESDLATAFQVLRQAKRLGAKASDLFSELGQVARQRWATRGDRLVQSAEEAVRRSAIGALRARTSDPELRLLLGLLVAQLGRDVIMELLQGHQPGVSARDLFVVGAERLLRYQGVPSGFDATTKTVLEAVLDAPTGQLDEVLRSQAQLDKQMVRGRFSLLRQQALLKPLFEASPLEASVGH
jgi:hypothetical protein